MESNTEEIKPAVPAGFSFFEKNAQAAITYEGEEILVFHANHASLGGEFLIQNQLMKPGGRVENAILPVLCTYKLAEAYYQLHECGESLSLRITPKRLMALALDGLPWEEELILKVSLTDKKTFCWTHRAILSFNQPVSLKNLPKGLHLYRFPHQNDSPGFFFQYSDPVPAGGSGPAVPMTRNWWDIPEPLNGPDAFTKVWQREYIAIILQNEDGSYVTSDLNKRKWHHLTRDNRRARPCAANGPFYLIKRNGEAVRYTVSAPSHYHHVCEWGMDFHSWCDLAPFAQDGVIPAGARIECETISELASSGEVAAILSQAKPLELTPEEFRIANLPAYEEPVNRFVSSALDDPDAHVWIPSSEGCRWETAGGKTSGHGILVIENRRTLTASWDQPLLGPSHWANPFIAGARYRFSVWVRVEPGWIDPSMTPGPQLGVTFHQFNGPASLATMTQISGGWSIPLCRNDRMTLPSEWTYIELITEPCPAYALSAQLTLRFTGYGRAFFSDVCWTIVE